MRADAFKNRPGAIAVVCSHKRNAQEPVHFVSDFRAGLEAVRPIERGGRLGIPIRTQLNGAQRERRNP